MTVAFVNDAETTNGTAGTSVVVSRPSGTENGHVLVAFISCVGSATISTPSGWTLIGGANPGGSVRMNAFYRVADGTEPASWTWTLGASQRNFGWVGCYSGVKTSAPIRASQETGDTTAGTGFTSTPTIALATGGMGVSAVAAIRTAAGAATTWTGTGQNERADLSTNAGSGTDIAGMVQDSVYTGTPLASYGPTWTASQSMTAGAMWAVTLQAEFIAPTAGALISRSVEVAWGADPDGDPDDWVFTDETQDLLDDPGVIVETGRDERAAIDQPANPTKIDLRLRNWRSADGITRTREGQYTPDNPNSPNYPNVIQRVPIRIVQPYGYTGETVRYTAFVQSWRPSWDASGKAAFVDVTAFGRLQWIRDEARPIHSALYRRMLGISGSGITPHAYYSCQDGSGATRIASAFPGHQPLQPSGAVSFGAASDLLGSDPLPTMSDTSTISGALGPAYTATGQWAVTVALKLPETEPVSEQRLLLVVCTGSAREWSLWLEPGSPASLTIRADIFGTNLLDDSISIVEADHFGKWRIYSIIVTQNGSDIDWQAWSYGADEGVGNSGTLAGRTIGVARVARLVTFSGLSGMGVGHIALYTDPDFVEADLADIAFAGLDGNDGDSPHLRFLALTAEENIPSSSDRDSDETAINMGPQPSGALGDLLQQCADTDHGMIHDATYDGALQFATRWARYNQDPAIVLDGSLGQVPGNVRPVFDNTGRISDSTVTRAGGSSARYAADAVGGKPDAKTLSLETDNHLFEIAGWRVALGNQPSMRYPSLPFNLRRNVDLVEDWFNTTIGSRMQATNMVTAHGPSDPDGIIVGWRETIRRDNWTVEPVLVSARPYDVPVLESGDETTWRLDMEGSTLATAAGSSDTSLLVACSGDARWGTDVPYDLDVLGERMTATAIASSATDAFGRTTANGWGTADSGQAWTTANGSASDFAVSSGTGRITNNSTGVLRGVLLDIESLDVDFSVDLVFPNASAATAVYERWVIGRATDTSNHYGALLQLGTSGGALTLAAFKRVGGTFTNLASKSAGTNAAGNTWRATVRIVGEPGSTKLYVTARNLTAGTPPVAVRVTSLDDATLTGTNIGVIDRRGTGNTDTGIVGQWDNLDVSMPQLMTVTRAVSGGANAKTHTAGETVRLWRARGLAL